MNKIISLLICSCTATTLFNQSLLWEALQYPVSVDGNVLDYPFAGGMNAPQFSEADINGDGTKDIFVFDRQGGGVHIYTKTMSNNVLSWEYAPQLAVHFPKLSHWAMLRDYNFDGAPDLFTAPLSGNASEIRVLKGQFESGILHFIPVYFTNPACPDCDASVLHYQDGSNWTILPSSVLGFPAIDDIDQDGDIDILSFEPATGNQLWWFRNMAVEDGATTDTLMFEQIHSCWGYFWDPVTASCSKVLSTGGEDCAEVLTAHPQRHPGSAITTISTSDQEVKNLLMGGTGLSCITLLKNGGSPENAWINAQDSLFPQESISVDMFTFPAAHTVDIDGDGDDDVLVAPNGSSLTLDRQNVWCYQQSSSGFQLLQKDYIIEHMIDVGTAAHPVLADVDGDGLTDMVVGNQGALTNLNPKFSALHFYKNTGTQQAPFFTLVDTNWLNMRQYSPENFDFYPAFGDMDDDGDTDVIVGSGNGTLFYFDNLTADGGIGFASATTDWMGIDPGISSTPFIYDLNHDGLNDLLVGERTGNINYYENIGTSQFPLFNSAPDMEKTGQIQTAINGFPFGNSTPVMISHQDTTMLITGTFEGSILAFIDPKTDTSTLLQWPGLEMMQWQHGYRSSVSLADVNGDGFYEMAAGTMAGGIRLYQTPFYHQTSGVINVHLSASSWQLEVAPNPARESLTLMSNIPMQWSVRNNLGAIIAHSTSKTGQSKVLTLNWPAGVYSVICINDNGESQVRNFIILSK